MSADQQFHRLVWYRDRQWNLRIFDKLGLVTIGVDGSLGIFTEATFTEVILAETPELFHVGFLPHFVGEEGRKLFACATPPVPKASRLPVARYGAHMSSSLGP